MKSGVFAYGAPSPIDTPGKPHERFQYPVMPNVPIPGPVKPTPETEATPSIWEKAGECKYCGAPIFSRRDSEKPFAVPEVRFNCNCRLRDDSLKKPAKKKRAR